MVYYSFYSFVLFYYISGILFQQICDVKIVPPHISLLFPCPFFLSRIKEQRSCTLLQIYAIHKKKSYVVCFLTLNLYNCVQFCIFTLLSLSPSSLIFFSFLKSCKHFSFELFVLLLSSYLLAYLVFHFNHTGYKKQHRLMMRLYKREITI